MKNGSQIKRSQIQPVEATMPVIPQRVVVAVVDIAESMRKGLLVWPWVLACRSCSHSMASHSARSAS
jgi:hypothetical protein